MIEKMIKWELRRLFKNKKFKIAFILQLLVILLIIPLFGSYVRALEEGGFFNLSVGGKGYLPIGIYSEKNSLTDIISENKRIEILWLCLLYTSDAADDLLCVDLGGRRIIKKKIYINTNVKDHANKTRLTLSTTRC